MGKGDGDGGVCQLTAALLQFLFCLATNDERGEEAVGGRGVLGGVGPQRYEEQ